MIAKELSCAKYNTESLVSRDYRARDFEPIHKSGCRLAPSQRKSCRAPARRSISVAHLFGDGKNLSHNTIDVRIGSAVVNDTSAQTKSRLQSCV
jgi:hypothetical protein